MKSKYPQRIIYILIALSIIYNVSFSQELEPRSYSVVPKKTSGVLLGYSFSSGAIVTDATSPLTDFSIVAHSFTAGGVRTMGIFGRLARIQMLIPYVLMSGDLKYKGKDTSGVRSGFADARIKFGVNIFGSPALSPKEFQRFKEETVLGTSIVISVPTGQYDNSKIVNLGANRWGFKPEIGFSYGYDKFYFEMYSGIWFFTPNSEYLKTNTLKQDPIFNFQAHTLYMFPSKIWLGIDLNYFSGGQSSINGIYNNDMLHNSRFGGVIGYPISKNHSLKFQAHTGLTTSSGSNYTILTLAYQYIWF